MCYHPDSDPYVSDARPGLMQRRLCAFFITITFILFCLFAFSGCLGAPVAIRTIEGKELQLSQEITWLTGTRLTVSGKDVKTYVQGQPSYAPPGPHVEASAEDRPGVGLKAPEEGGAPSSPDPHVKSELDEKKKKLGVSGLGSGEPLSK